MTITAKDVKELRDKTGAGMMDCKKALQEADGDMEKAIDILRTSGAAKAAKRSERATNHGTLGSYLHFGGRIGVLVELNCETDFVANTEDFQQLAKDLAMHVAAANPLAVRTEDVPEAVVAKEREIYLEQVKAEGKPENIQEKIVEGKLQKFFKENVLLKQPFVKDPDKSVEALVTEVSAKTGENIGIARFARMEVGVQS
jgi:elongation factor Ts